MGFGSSLSTLKDALTRLYSFFNTDWKLCVGVVVYIIFFSILTILKHHTFLTTGFDLGIFKQAFWTTLFEHKLFYETGNLSFNSSGSVFGVHFSPILFILLPFYAVYPSVETLLVIQSTVLALGAVPLYWMARERLGKNLALYISILYLIYPPLNYINVNDFHLQAFLPAFFLFTVYYLERERWPNFLLFTILSLATIEFVPIIVAFIALYGLMLYKQRKFVDSKKALRYIVLTFLLAILWFFLAMKVKELFNPHTSPIPTPWPHALSNPISLLHTLLNDWGLKVFYVVCLLGPLGFMPLLALEPLVMALPWIGASFITNYPLYYSVYFQYTGFVIAFIFIALIKAIERLTAKGTTLKRMKKILIMLFSATTISALFLPFTPISPWMYQLPIPTEQSTLSHEVMSLVPQNASILTQNNFFPHVCSRVDAFMYIPPYMNVSVDYILVDVASIWYGWGADISGEKILPSDVVPEALRNEQYGILASVKSILLLKRGYTNEPIIFVPYMAKCDYNTLVLADGSIVEDSTSSSGYVLYHYLERESIFWYGPYVALTPGLYNVTYVFKIGSQVNPTDEILKVELTTQNGEVLLAEKPIYGEHVSSKDKWFNVTLTFGLDNVAENVEFRGFAYSNYEIYLDYIFIEQLSTKPS